MKWLFSLLIILITGNLYAQKLGRNIIFMQVGLGKVVETGPPSIVNVSCNYERTFLSEKHWRIGGQIAFGYWTNGSVYSDANISGQQAFVVATVKFSVGASHRHYFGIDGGYAFFRTGSTDEAAEPVKSHYHLPAAAVSYQYYAARGFYGRAGVSTWQGLFLGLGRGF